MTTSPIPLPGLSAIRKRMLAPVMLDQDLDAQKVRPGDHFTITIHVDKNELPSDTTTELDVALNGLQFEAEVLGVRKTHDGTPAAILFRIAHLLKPDHGQLLVIPVTASLLKPKNSQPGFLDTDDMAQASQQYGNNLGEILNKIDGNLDLGTWAWSRGKDSASVMARHPIYLKGQLTKGTRAVIRIEKSTYY